nr:TadA family conjugal transfer-associated ATPase [Nocardioides marmorisolisilvae]
MRDRLALDGAEVTPQSVASALRKGGRPIGHTQVLAVHDALRRDVLGAGPLEELIALPGVTDVLVNGPSEVWVDRGNGLELTGVRFGDDDSVRRLAQRLAAAGGRRLDDASPFVDLRLSDGTRFHAVLAPLSRPGTLVSLRVPRRRAFDLAGLASAGMVSPDGATLLDRIVRSRCAFLVSGGTGTGKTTLLNTMLSLVDPRERLVIVEDASELRPEHPHVVALEARPPNIEGAGAITLQMLVRQALRMRPDRLVVGEVRGAEVVDLLAAMNTGHEGGCGTVHANSPAAIPARIETMALAAGLNREAARAMFGAAVDLVIHVVRSPNGARRVGAIGVLDGVDGVSLAVRFADDLQLVPGPAAGRLEELLAG